MVGHAVRAPGVFTALRKEQPMPCRFPLIALPRKGFWLNVHVLQRAGKHRRRDRDARRIEEYNP
jgi:hypothetical protein